MRVLQVMAGAEKGGAEKFFDRLVPALARRGLDQHVICRSFPDRLSHLKACHIPFTTASFHRLLDFQTRRIIRQTIHFYQPDIVLTWMSRATYLCPKENSIFVARLGGYYDLKYYKKADYLVGNTPDIQNYFIKEGWPAERTAYLPNFVDAPRPEVPPQDRAVYCTPEKAPLLLSLGRFHDDKAFDVLISALSRLPGVYLWLAGEGEREKRLRCLAQEHGVHERIRFIKWQKDVDALYKAADVYVCPSRVEPLGNVVIEAWSHGLPVVAAESAGPRGLIQHQENGLLVPVDHAEALAHAIKEVLASKSLRRKLAARGLATYLANYTEERVCARYGEFLEKIYRKKKER